MDLESVFLQGMLSEKEPVGFSNSYGVSGKAYFTEDIDDEEPTENDWKNL